MFARYVEVEVEDAPAKREVQRLEMFNMLWSLSVVKVWCGRGGSIVVDRTKVGKCDLAECRG